MIIIVKNLTRFSKKDFFPKFALRFELFWFRRSSQIKTEKRDEGTEKRNDQRRTEQIIFWNQITLNFFCPVASFGKNFVTGFSKKEWK